VLDVRRARHLRSLWVTWAVIASMDSANRVKTFLPDHAASVARLGSASRSTDDSIRTFGWSPGAIRGGPLTIRETSRRRQSLGRDEAASAALTSTTWQSGSRSFFAPCVLVNDTSLGKTRLSLPVLRVANYFICNQIVAGRPGRVSQLVPVRRLTAGLRPSKAPRGCCTRMQQPAIGAAFLRTWRPLA